MKNRILALAAAAIMTLSLVGCNGIPGITPTTAETTEAVTESTEKATVDDASVGEATVSDSEAKATEGEPTIDDSQSLKIGTEGEGVRVGSLKGPTTMGLVNLMAKSEAGEAEQDYSFEIAVDPSVVTAKLMKNELDIALVPANVASVLYNKSKGNIVCLDINTLGVLYCVTGDGNIRKMNHLFDRKVVMTGQGTTPEYVTKYLMNAYGITNCTIEYRSEATEVVEALVNDPTLIGILPQPFATAATIQNPDLHQAFSLTNEWDKVVPNATLVTGVTITTKGFLEKNPDAVAKFLEEAEASTEAANKEIEATSELVVKYGIIEKAPVAAKALPYCGVTYIDGEKMKNGLSGYLEILHNYNPDSVGGDLPGEDFYYIPEVSE